MNNKLEYSQFEINFVYGFTMKPLNKNSFKQLKINPNKFLDTSIENKEDKSFERMHLIRNGWSTFYNLVSVENSLIQDLPVDNLTGTQLSISKPKNRIGWKSSFNNLRFKLFKTISLRKDGFGTLTLTLKFDRKKDSSSYYTSDILRALLLVPRTLYKDDDSLSQLETEIVRPESLGISKDKWENFSSLYKIYISTLFQLFPNHFKPIFFDPIKEEKKAFVSNRETICTNSDAQIPTIFVFGEVPSDIYYPLFINKDKEYRKQYFNDIAGILGRWLNEYNLKNVSKDYWKTDNVLNNRFMNSLVFTTFSAMVTLTLHPKLEDTLTPIRKKLSNKPISITHETILRYLEFSRLRWHYAIELNKELDRFIDSASNLKNQPYLHLIKKIVSLEKKMLIHLENPSEYLWDASLGSNLIKFYETQIISNIENEISKKMENVRMFVNNQIRYESTRQLLNE